MTYIYTLLIFLFIGFKILASVTVPPLIEFQSNLGTFYIILFTDRAPLTCNNFLRYVEEGLYDNTISHRLIPGYLIQFGAFKNDLTPLPSHAPIVNEARFTPSNTLGTLAMAFPRNKHNEASTQFFINLNDNDQLDFSSSTFKGYTVFGKIVNGKEILSKFQFYNTQTKTISIQNKNIVLKHFPTPVIKIYSLKLIKNERIIN